jgi:hypothetical protein
VKINKRQQQIRCVTAKGKEHVRVCVLAATTTIRRLVNQFMHGKSEKKKMNVEISLFMRA